MFLDNLWITKAKWGQFTTLDTTFCLKEAKIVVFVAKNLTNYPLGLTAILLDGTLPCFWAILCA